MARDRNTSIRTMKAAARRLLRFIEREIARNGGCAKIYDDEFAVVGSRRVIGPGLSELERLGLIEHERHVKYSICRVSERWRTINPKQAREQSTAAMGATP